MTRFNLTLSEGVNFVLKCAELSKGGEIFVPKIPSYKIMDVVKAIAPKAKIRFVGKRPGEKIDEELITKSDSLNALEFKNFFIIFPNNKSHLRDYYLKKFKGKKLQKDFSYNSRENKFLSVSKLRELIKDI